MGVFILCTQVKSVWWQGYNWARFIYATTLFWNLSAFLFRNFVTLLPRNLLWNWMTLALRCLMTLLSWHLSGMSMIIIRFWSSDTTKWIILKQKKSPKRVQNFLWNHFHEKKPAKKIIFMGFPIRTFFDSKWLTEQHYHKLFHNEWNILYYIWSRISHPELFHRLCHTFVHYEDRIFQRK